MTAAARDQLGPGAARERGWGRTLVAFAAALLVSAAAAWPPAAQPLAALVRVLVPLQETMLLVAPSVAACALVGWWAGGRLALAVVWVAIAAFVMAQPVPGRADAYAAAARGWALLLAGAFGAACVLAGTARPFIGRALAAVGVAFVLATGSLAATGHAPARIAGVVRAEYQRRVTRSLAVWRKHARGPAWRRGADLSIAARAADAVDRLEAIPEPAVRVLPALLGLESLAALGLAWSLYHRLARARLGPPLARLAEFRFNDQLVWGVVAGATLAVLPSFEEFRPLGLNVLLFFGALYALRGLGVLRWWADGWLANLGAAGAVLVALLLVPVTGIVLPTALLGAAALALGLGDTVAGWRARPRAAGR